MYPYGFLFFPCNSDSRFVIYLQFCIFWGSIDSLSGQWVLFDFIEYNKSLLKSLIIPPLVHDDFSM